MDYLPADVVRQLQKDSAKFIAEAYEKELNRKFDKIKSQMISDFLNHPVTQEIKSGPDGANISGTLGGQGNLFSYIGFNNGDDPIDPVLKAFEKTTVKLSRLIDGGAEWTIFMPAKEDIWDVSPMPWATGRSWAKGIETGISGLGFYFYSLRGNMATSRSGTGLQVQSKLNSKSRFRNIKYISEILSRYEKKFSQLDETSIST
jgi:hypothetical protein